MKYEKKEPINRKPYCSRRRKEKSKRCELQNWRRHEIALTLLFPSRNYFTHIGSAGKPRVTDAQCQTAEPAANSAHPVETRYVRDLIKIFQL